MCSRTGLSRSAFLGAENLLKVLFKVDTRVREPALVIVVGGVDFLGVVTGVLFGGGGGGVSGSLEPEEG